MDRNQELRNILWLLVLTAVAAQLTTLTGLSKSPLSTIQTSYIDGETFLAFALKGTFLIYLWTRPKRSEVVTVCLFGIVLNVVLFWMRVSADRTVERVLTTCGYGFGTSSFLVLAIQAWREQGEQRLARLNTLMAGSVIPLYVLTVEFFLRLTYVHTQTYDRILYAFDGSLGMQLSFLAGRLFVAHNWLKDISLLIYLALPLAFSLLIAYQAKYPERSPVNIIGVFVGVGAIGYLLYHIYPAIGPRYMLGNVFPMGTPPPAVDHSLLSCLTNDRRNAMPSLHTAWVLVWWWNTRWYASWIKIFGYFFVGLTLLCTLGIGEHYVIDLVVALPFAVAAQAAYTKSVPLWSLERGAALGSGIFLTFLWLGLIRFGLPLFEHSVLVSWIFMGGTVAVSLFLENRLAQRVLSQVPSCELRSGTELVTDASSTNW